MVVGVLDVLLLFSLFFFVAWKCFIDSTTFNSNNNENKKKMKIGQRKAPL